MIVLDRYYFGLEFVYELEKLNQKYMHQKKINKQKKLQTMKIRIIKVELEEEVEYLVTNLTEEEMTREEAKMIDHLIWNIEKEYDVSKNKLRIENYSSRTREGIEIKFYTGILVYNVLDRNL